MEKWKEKKITKIKELYEKEKNIYEVGRQLNMSRKTVYKYLKIAQIK